MEENTTTLLKELSNFEPLSQQDLEELEIQKDIERQEKAEEPIVINSVLVEAGINPYKQVEDYSENESYYEQL